MLNLVPRHKVQFKGYVQSKLVEGTGELHQCNEGTDHCTVYIHTIKVNGVDETHIYGKCDFSFTIPVNIIVSTSPV